LVVADSHEEPERMENHARRPEIVVALSGGIGRAVRFSRTLHERMMYVAIPIKRDGRLLGVARAAIPITAIEQTLQGIYLKIVLGGLAAVLLTGLLSLYMSRRISRPLEEIRRGAERFAKGDLTSRLTVAGSVEIVGLAESLNQMVTHLNERIQTVLHQRNEQEAVLASMVEGVLAVDTDERIIRINQAAGRLLGVHPEAVQGRRLHEVIRKADLLRFVDRALASREPVEGDIVLQREGEQYLQAHGTVLRGAHGQENGALIVLNDVTRLRRLESLRRDFVANVSHELKTPITAIKGFVETLLDGAIDRPEDSRRFLGIITKQAERLNAIIDDLLALSRIEQEGERSEVPLHPGVIAEVLKGAQQACAIGASGKGIHIEVTCEEILRARINAPLLEQAVINLIDNAVKYSEAEQAIEVTAAREGAEVVIRVRDHGRGIDAEHLPRLFERFYRVDKARSRKQGGTGLGLAIVKHIAAAHGGQVTVSSVPGEGSVFAIHLPASE
ncbi:MAG TPA: ATP-binding protein, partial [Desulfuromonadales bacterium]|nr:ATP-binding protein [Desulfuromonadales bacterium]